MAEQIMASCTVLSFVELVSCLKNIHVNSMCIYLQIALRIDSFLLLVVVDPLLPKETAGKVLQKKKASVEFNLF